MSDKEVKNIFFCTKIKPLVIQQKGSWLWSVHMILRALPNSPVPEIALNIADIFSEDFL